MGRVSNAVLTSWLSFFGAPGILLTDKDTRIIGSELPQLRNGQNITPQTVTPCHRQCLGSTDRRRMYSRGIMRRILDKKNKKKDCERRLGGYMLLCLRYA